MKQLNEFTIEHLTDFSKLSDFYSGENQMDDFIHEHLEECTTNHYCTSYCVKTIEEGDIAAIFALSFDSVDLDHDDFDDMRIGAAMTELPNVDDSFRERFEEKYTYPALEITYLAVDKKYQHLKLGSSIVEEICNVARSQEIAGCLFLTVKALCTKEYSAVSFYEKCHFTKQTPVPKSDIWPMYKTLWT